VVDENVQVAVMEIRPPTRVETCFTQAFRTEEYGLSCKKTKRIPIVCSLYKGYS
jgi:hypothetical protein